MYEYVLFLCIQLISKLWKWPIANGYIRYAVRSLCHKTDFVLYINLSGKTAYSCACAVVSLAFLAAVAVCGCCCFSFLLPFVLFVGRFSFCYQIKSFHKFSIKLIRKYSHLLAHWWWFALLFTFCHPFSFWLYLIIFTSFVIWITCYELRLE